MPRTFSRLRRCYNCNEPGHFAADCPEPIIRVFETAGIRKNVDYSKRANFTSNSGGVLYMIDVMVGSKTVEVLIDSGSTGEFIEIDAVPNDVNIDQTDITTIEGFTGKTVTSVGSVTTNVKTAPDGTEFEEVRFLRC